MPGDTNDRRLERIETAVAEQNRLMGQLIAGQENLDSFIKAVSKNTSDFRLEAKQDIAHVSSALMQHKESIDAHGAAAAREVKGSTILWGGLIIAGLEAVGHWVGNIFAASGPHKGG